MSLAERVARAASTKRGAESGDEQIVVSVSGLEKKFRRANGEWTNAVDGVTIDIRAGELVVVLGSSGCGKTTLLRCIAGLEQPTGGEIRSAGKLMSSARGQLVPPERRNFGMMFQSYAVWPHMSVFKNVAYPLVARHVRRSEIEQRVTRALELAGIAHLRDEFSSQLSGGQQQRVALARCLVADPSVILFDEPLSNVDAKVREDLRIEILAMKERIGFGGLYVTHDQEEAMAIADRIAVMDKGRIVQIGTPREIYDQPQDLFVARFVGNLSTWNGTVRTVAGESGRAVVETDLGDVEVDGALVPDGINVGDAVLLAVRPEQIEIAAGADAGPGNAFKGTVVREVFRGTYNDCAVDLGGVTLHARVDNLRRLEEGTAVVVRLPAERIRVLRAGSSVVKA